jgi:hypothetical protein
MTKGLPDSMTYTMGRRVFRTIKDKSAQRSAQLDADLETVAVFFRVIGWVVLGVGYLILGALYIVASPLFLIVKLMKHHEARSAKKEQTERYHRALEKRSKKKVA